MWKFVISAFTHGIALVIGVALGVYFLPIATAPPSPTAELLAEISKEAVYSAEITKDLRGNDLLHWGKGTLKFTSTQLVHSGVLAPGPDYMVYLVPEFVEHEDEFLPLKDDSRLIGPVKTFKGFMLDLPPDVNIENYTTVLVWCEAFSEFIAAAKYR